MRAPLLHALHRPTMDEHPFEIVERKGVGHPDSICDAVMEDAARALARTYVERTGAPQHFNLDKCLLAAGRSVIHFGGGSVEEPMRLVFGDRATSEREGVVIPVRDVLFDAADRWFRNHLRYVDPARHVVFQSEVRPGSVELAGLFAGGDPAANDTSAAVGFAPLSRTERIVLEAERFLASNSMRERFPEAGEDVKIMAVRRGAAVALTFAVAFVDRFVASEAAYFRRKDELRDTLTHHLSASEPWCELDVHLNTLDRTNVGIEGVYLTVTGTSAESADSGQVGRGNQICGLFASGRPSTNEAFAGKNPQSHVGKIYNVLAERAARDVAALHGVREAVVYLVSQIGRPLSDPQLAAAELVLDPDADLSDLRSSVEEVLMQKLSEGPRFADEWLA